MFVSGPVVSGPAVGGHTGMVLTTVGRRTFDAPARIVVDPEHRARHAVYLTDMLQPYGQVPHIANGRGHSYGEMAHQLITATVPPEEPVDLLVLAFAVPDIAPGRATATYLSHVCPGNPLAFAMCDAGTATAFGAWTVIGAYLGSGVCRSGLLVVAEQADLHHEPLPPAPVPTTHTAVALRFEAADTESVTVHEQEVAPDEVGALFDAAVAELSAAHHDATVVVGPLLAQHAEVPAGTRVGDVGRPYTGLWWELAAELDSDRASGRRVVLADYDPRLRRLTVTATDLGATRAQAGRRTEAVVPA